MGADCRSGYGLIKGGAMTNLFHLLFKMGKIKERASERVFKGLKASHLWCFGEL